MYSVHDRVSVDNMSEFDEHEDTMCEKFCQNSKRTTGAEDTQNQNYQRVLAVVDTSSQTERVSFVEEVFMMSERSAECDAVRGFLESPMYRDYDPTLHRRRSINLPDEPTVIVTKADSAIHVDLSIVCVVDAKKRISSLDSRINGWRTLFRPSEHAGVTCQMSLGAP